MLGRPAALALAALLLIPTAAAFSTQQQELFISYASHATPVVIAAGKVGLAGSISSGFFVGGSTATTLAKIPHLMVAERGNLTGGAEVFDGTLEITHGALLWAWDRGAVRVDAGAPYAIGLALPRAPLPSGNDTPPAGFVVASEAIAGNASWSGEPLTLTPLDAVITIRDAAGQPLRNWNGRHVNADTKTAGESDASAVVLSASGVFRASIGSQILAAATGDKAAANLTVGRAAEDRYSQTLALITDATSGLGKDGSGSFGGRQNPLSFFESVSGLLNGALIVVPGDGTTGNATPLASRWGPQDFAIGQINVARGDDLRVEWAQNEMHLAGTPTVALGREGFAVEPPLSVWLFPIASLVLWLVAIAAIVLFFVKRPPKGDKKWSLRLLSLAIHLVALLIVAFLWDRSFLATFGVSAVEIAKAQGISGATIPQIGAVAALEFVPWSIAGLLFALPVRIAAGVALRYLGRGKSYKGIAATAGLVSLAVFGPIYALYCFNLVWGEAAKYVGH